MSSLPVKKILVPATVHGRMWRILISYRMKYLDILSSGVSTVKLGPLGTRWPGGRAMRRSREIEKTVRKCLAPLRPDLCCCSVAKLCPTLCDPMNYTTPGFLSFTISWSLLKFMSIELVMLSNCLILCHSCLSLPSIFPNIRVFSNEMALHIR